MKFIKLTLTLLLIIFSSPFSFAQNQLTHGEHLANINGVKIQYFVKGNGPVCLIPSPGWGPSVDYLKNTMKPFEKYFTMVYYNTRLSGKSTGPKDPTKYTSSDLINDMDGLRAYFNQSRVWLMGHSAGGFQALYYGINYSDRLNGIIAITPLAGRDSLDGSRYTQTIMNRKKQANFEKISNILLGKDTTKYKTSEWLDITLPFFFHDPIHQDSLVKHIGAPFSDRAADNNKISKFSTEYLFPELHKIKVPFLVITGDDDFLSNMISQSNRIVRDIKNSHEIVINNSGHFPWIEQPEQFFEESINWLKAQGLKEQN